MIGMNKLGTKGRLGNQMFQYASLVGIAKNMGYDFCIPDHSKATWFDKEIDGNKWGYSAEETLMADKVRVYTLQHEVTEENQKPVCIVKPADISPTLGIEVSTFDQTINEMNAIQDEIYYNLRDKI